MINLEGTTNLQRKVNKYTYQKGRVILFDTNEDFKSTNSQDLNLADFLNVTLWSLLGCSGGVRFVLTHDMILQPNQNPLLLRVFMDLFCAFVRVNLLADKVKS